MRTPAGPFACVALLCTLGAHRAEAQDVNPNPMDSIRKLPGYRSAHDTITLVSATRIATLPPTQRDAWTAYVARSRAAYDRDTVAMRRELRTAGATEMTRAPYTHDFSVKDCMTAAWFATDTAKHIADVILTFQAPNGGWSKHVDFTKHARRRGESYYAESADWEWISTVDNSSTTEEIRFLSLANASRHDPRYAEAIRRGIDYLLASQYPNGCIPQVYPLEGSYHDAATFNDDAMVNVLSVFRDVADGRITAATESQRAQSRDALARGIDCILDRQVRVNGKLTAWGQQHDPMSVEPVAARSYELASLTALESASIVDFLMEEPSPSPRVVRALYAATDWLKAVPLYGYAYDRYILSKQDGAGPLWGRLYEIGTNKIIMANRDGVKLYDWNKLTDRRSGYGWYTTKPAETLAAFDRWSKQHPRVP